MSGPTVTVGFLDQDYRYKSGGTQISQSALLEIKPWTAVYETATIIIIPLL